MFIHSFIHCSFIDLSIIWGHMGCPQDLAIVTKAAVVIGVQVSAVYLYSVPYGSVP